MSGQTLAWSEVIMASRCVWSGSVLLVLLSPVLSSSHLHPASTYPLGSLHHQPLNPVYNNGMPSVWKSFSECVINFDCSSDKVCVNKKCQDPCPGLCGVNAYCNVRSHVPVCTCNAGVLGNPFTSCYRPAPTTPRPKTSDACSPSPCGVNAECRQRDGAASCRCYPGLQGDPHVACSPECVTHADCPASKLCRNLHCHDPCPGLCGSNAHCLVGFNHIPVCLCNQGHFGDPLVSCRPYLESLYI